MWPQVALLIATLVEACSKLTYGVVSQAIITEATQHIEIVCMTVLDSDYNIVVKAY